MLMATISVLLLFLAAALCTLDFPLRDCFVLLCIALLFALGAIYGKFNEILKELKKKQ